MIVGQGSDAASTAAVLNTHPCFSNNLWVKVIFAIGNHKNNQTRDCCPVIFFTGTLHQCHIILLLQIHFINAIIARIRQIREKT